MSARQIMLYVEDDPFSREIMAMLFKYDLGLSNFTIWEDSNNFEVRLQCLSPPPNIIFLDIHMNPITGFEMLEILRRTDVYMDACVVALTASVMNDEIQRLKEAGFNGAIAKPIDQDAFPEVFRRIADGEEVWSTIG
jgi:CheY-like chemotaxis protein